MKLYTSTLLTFLLFLLCSVSFGQTISTVGTGTIANGNTEYPAPYGNYWWGAKHQFLITAAELSAAGMTDGDINSLAFDVEVANGVVLTGFEIKLKLTSSPALTTTFETGATSVYGPTNYADFAGWNPHVFGTPFYWDGVSNLLVETCFNNGTWTTNAQTRYSTTGFQSSGYYRQDQAGVCAVTTATTSNDRPNMRFDWNPGNVPPQTNFSSNTTYTCSGLVDFTDLSLFNPTSWQWDFGDAGTSTQQNPSHSYGSNGVYTVELIACNSFGCDTIIFNNYITVNSGAGAPVPTTCYPATLTYCCGFGITNMSFNTLNNSSNDGADGYSDFTCVQTTVTEGQTYTLTVETPVPTTHNVAAWIDYNNDGVLNDVAERVMTSNSALTHGVNVQIPTGVTLNQPLRLRISADYDFSAPPTSCADVEFGQVEDYTVVIQANTSPPTADFIVSDTVTCDGTVSFTDISGGLPTQWAWDFGDLNTSNQQHPTHTYASSGSYSVTLTATNSFGNDIQLYNNMVTVNLSGQLLSPACAPTTLSYCCGYGIGNLTFAGIDFDSPDGVEGYVDNSCQQVTSVTEGQNYPVLVRTGQNSPQDTRIWIDYNNDGVLDDITELAFTALNDYSPTGTIAIPGGAVLGTPLRMRVSSDVVGGAQTSCSNSSFGQTEDYALIIITNVLPPTTNFVVDSTLVCAGQVTFTDLTTNGPTTWAWDFGDGLGTSTAQNPTYTYPNPGTYTVTLTTTNANGSDQHIIANYITYDPNACTVYIIPQFGVANIDQCFGTLYDNGGPTGNYLDNTSGTTIIAPTGASSVTVTFVMFDFVSSFGTDSIFIYDGPNVGSPLIGSYGGNGLPNGGAPIVSSGGSITLQMITDNNTSDPGFEMNWSCNIGGGTAPVADFSTPVTSICENACINFFDSSTNNPTSWTWSFPGGTPATSSAQNPTAICYNTSGTYGVTLSVTNSFGTDGATFVSYITVAACAAPLPNFTASATNVCEGLCVDFTDLTSGGPTGWNWTFPGGTPGTSTAQNPTVCYPTSGLFGVTLSATNANGTSDTTFISYINVSPCDTVFIPSGGSTTEIECSGVIMDDGGPGNYSNNSDGSVTISPTGAIAVNLTFTAFQFDVADSLYLYDGPSQLSPLIGAYTGSTLPNGGSVSASSGSMTVRQVTDGAGVDVGFEATWDCQLDGIDASVLLDQNLSIYPNPSSDVLNINYSTDAKTGPIVVFMVNALGQVVFTDELKEQSSFTSQVDVSTLGKGIYFIILQSSDHQIVRKSVIE